MGKIYHALLWFCGFEEGEHISGMLARQRQRLGRWWWFLPIGTIAIMLGLSIWLTVHIARYKAKS
jgi:hypothetical protein